MASFWTPERISQAVPINIEHTTSQQPSQAVTAPVQREIPDEDRMKPPYNSIGPLLYTVTQGGHQSYYRSTAYATNASGQKNVVFTAAHSLVGPHGLRENISFMPAIFNDGTKPFGEFKQIEGGLGTAFFVHPRYDGTIGYDIGAVKLQPNGRGENLGDVISLLDITINQQYTEATIFRAIGYVQNTQSFEENMLENVGKFHSKEGEIVYKLGQLYGGCSGGPWFLNS